MGNCAFCGKKLGWTDFKGELGGQVYCKEHYNQILQERREKYSPSLIQGETVLLQEKYSGKLWRQPGECEVTITNLRAWILRTDMMTVDDVFLSEIDDVLVLHAKSERDSFHTGTVAGFRGVGSYGGQSWGSSQTVGDISLMSTGMSAMEIPDIGDPHGLKQLILATKKQTKPSYDQEIEINRQRFRCWELKHSLGLNPNLDFESAKEQMSKFIAALEQERDKEKRREEEETKRFEESKRSLISIITDLLNAKIGDSIRLEAMKSDLEAGRTLTDEDSELLKKWTIAWGGLTTFEGKEQASIIESEKKKTPRKEDVFDELKKLATLRDSGVITNEEFESKKKELLSRI